MIFTALGYLFVIVHIIYLVALYSGAPYSSYLCIKMPV